VVARGEGLEETSVDPNDGVAVERGMGRLGAEMANKGPRDTDPEKKVRHAQNNWSVVSGGNPKDYQSLSVCFFYSRLC
jgi:hypothetical protein